MDQIGQAIEMELIAIRRAVIAADRAGDVGALAGLERYFEAVKRVADAYNEAGRGARRLVAGRVFTVT